MFDDVLLDRIAVERDEVKAAQDRIMRIAAARLAPAELADIQRRRDYGLPFLDLALTDIVPISAIRNWADLAQPPERDEDEFNEYSQSLESSEDDDEPEFERPEEDYTTWLLKDDKQSPK